MHLRNPLVSQLVCFLKSKQDNLLEFFQFRNAVPLPKENLLASNWCKENKIENEVDTKYTNSASQSVDFALESSCIP